LIKGPSKSLIEANGGLLNLQIRSYTTEADFLYLRSSLRLRVSALKNLVWKTRNRGISITKAAKGKARFSAASQIFHFFFAAPFALFAPSRRIFCSQAHKAIGS
jgi:hypothetical protein